MKRLLILSIAILFMATASAQVTYDDRVYLNQVSEQYPGFFSTTYQGLYPTGHSQFKMFKYGGLPGAPTATSSNTILGSFIFNGHNGSNNLISAVIRARTITGVDDPRLDFVLATGGTNRTTRMTIIGQSGNVGIGTNDPTQKFDVDGAIRMRTGATAGYIPVSDADGVMTWTDPYNVIPQNPELWIQTGSGIANLFGDVGVGTFSPTQKLDVDGAIRMRTGATAGYIPVSDADGVMTWTDPYNVIPQNPELWIQTGSGIANLFGDVGVGTFSPTQKLDVDGAIRMRTGATAGYIPVSDADGVMTWTDPYNVIPQNPQLWIQTGSGIANSFGFVGIGSFNPNADLHILQSSNTAFGSGGVLYEDLSNPNTWKTYHGGTHFSFAENGVRLAYVEGNGLGNFITVSDRSFKKNIKSIPNILDKVMELNPVSYLYKHQTSEKSNLGFIAQDVQELFPEIVATSEDNSLGINYAASGVIAIKAIQEQQGIIDEQKDKIKQLEAELETVKNQQIQQYEDMLSKFAQLENAMGDCCMQSNDIPKQTDSNTSIELNGSDVPALEQNTPNPFHEQTIIRYYIPSTAKSANMTITDIKGTPLKSVNLAERGLGTVTINANELPVGTYIYTLFVDGRQVASKQMILVR